MFGFHNTSTQKGRRLMLEPAASVTLCGSSLCSLPRA